MPAWIPLAIVIAAACTVSGARVAGGVLALILIALFVYSGIRVELRPAVPEARLARGCGRPGEHAVDPSNRGLRR